MPIPFFTSCFLILLDLHILMCPSESLWGFAVYHTLSMSQLCCFLNGYSIFLIILQFQKYESNPGEYQIESQTPPPQGYLSIRCP